MSSVPEYNYDESLPPLKRYHYAFLETLAKMWGVVLEEKRMDDAPKKVLSDAERIGNVEKRRDMERLRKKYTTHLIDNLKRTLYLRAVNYKAYSENSEYRESENKKCKESFLHWINWYVMTENPKELAQFGVPTKIPMILTVHQEEVLTEIDKCYRSNRHVLVEKSREMGATWLMVAYSVWNWLYSPHGFKATLGSRKESLVDEMGNPDTLFSKARFIVYNLPMPMRPEGFDRKGGRGDCYMKLINENGNTIVGEAGDNIGRGGRSSFVLIDEKAFLEHPETVDSALSSNTNCQIDLSTPNGPNSFYKKRNGGGVKVITMNWWKDPSKNEKWRDDRKPSFNAWYAYKEMVFAHDPTIIRREIDLDYLASVEGIMIPTAWVDAAVNLELKPEGERVGGFDVAGGGKNESVYIGRHGVVVSYPAVFNYGTSTENILAALDAAENDEVSVLNYDMDGIGESMFGILKTTDRRIPFICNGIHGAHRASEEMIDSEGRKGNEKYINYRGQLWDGLRVRFKKTFEHVNGIRLYPTDELISIPDDLTLRTQLSSVKEKRSAGGKFGAEAKDDMRKRGIDSPDRADALAYCFASGVESSRVVDGFDYTKRKSHYVNFEKDPTRSPGCDTYVSIVQTPDMRTSAICCVWSPSGQLRVFAEFNVANASAKDTVKWAREECRDDVKTIKEWIANDEMFDTTGKWARMAPWFLYRREKVSLHRNYSDDYRGSIMLLNTMFDGDMIKIHTDCDVLMMQLSNWVKSGGEPMDNVGLAMALCQMVTRLRKQRRIDTAKIVKKTEYNGAMKFGESHQDDHTVSRFLNLVHGKEKK